jgi:hypothetical protein
MGECPENPLGRPRRTSVDTVADGQPGLRLADVRSEHGA